MLEDCLRKPKSLYYAFPGWAKRCVGGLYGQLSLHVRLGRSYGAFEHLLQESRSWDEEQARSYQFEQTRKTLEQAYEHVPFYRKRFDEEGVSPSDFKALKDIRKFPFLTKRDIQDHFDELIADHVPRRLFLETRTGGSTAEPLRFLQEKGVTRSKEKAFINDGWSRVGYMPGARCVQLKGRSVGSPEQGVFWEYEPIQRYLEMDSNYLTEENVPAYIQAITEFQPEFMIGFVSSIYLLARYLSEHPKDNFPSLRAVCLTSENVYPEQRRLLESVFQCRVFSHYGHSEMVLLGMECEDSHDLHFYPQYGYLEILDAENEPICCPGESGELVGTSFHNRVMPLIRYRTRDMGTLGDPNCVCGRVGPMVRSVEGRLQEFIVTSDERLISICTMGAAHFGMADWVFSTQYFQDQPGVLIFKVVPRPGYDVTTRNKIQRILEEKLGKSVDVHVVEVDKLERTSTGKHMMIVQKLTIDGFTKQAGNGDQS